MTQIVKILVPHDGTEMSDKAFKKAIELAKAFAAKLILLHVIEEIPVPPSMMLGGDTILINRARRSVRRELEKGWDKMVEIKTHEFEDDDNVSLSGECRYGSAADQILRFAKDNKINTIVMGSRRLKGLSKLKALGSVTRKVSELANCPVLIVH